MGEKKAGWKFLSIHRDELKFTLPLFLLYFLSGSFYTVGQIYSESFFLKSYGAQGLSRFFIYNGVSLILCGILYNIFMLRLTLRRGYLLLIGIFTGLITASRFIDPGKSPWLPFALYLGNYLFTFFLDLHFFNFIFQFLDLRNSKRIVPFVMGGGKLGGIVTSLLIFSLLSRHLVDLGLLLWGLNGVLLLIPLVLLKKGRPAMEHRVSRRGAGETGPGTGLLKRLEREMRITYSSSIFSWTAALVFAVSITNQISEYYFMSIFNRAFPTRGELASFLGVYTFCADLVTLGLQLFAVSRFIKKAGVPAANLVYPSSFIGTMIFLISSPALAAGVLMRFFRKNLSLLIRMPVFNIIMASSPRDRMAEVKSFINGIVSPLGMVAGGGFIHLIFSSLNTSQGYMLTLGVGLFALACTFGQNRAYVLSLKGLISSAVASSAVTGPGEDLGFITGEDTVDGRHLTIIEALFVNSPGLNLGESLLPHFSSLSGVSREKILILLAGTRKKLSNDLLGSCLADTSPQVRSAALAIVKELPYGERTRLLREHFSPAGIAEHDALVILSSRSGRSIKEGEDIDGFAAVRVDDIKHSVLEARCDPEEFITLSRVLRAPYFLDPLVRLCLSTGNLRLFDRLIPYAENLTEPVARRILYRFKRAPAEMIARYIMLAKNLTEAGRIILLDHRENIPYEQMVRYFQPDDRSTRILLRRLLRHRKYFRIINYLNYFLCLGIKPAEEMRAYIEYTVDTLLHLQRAKNILARELDEILPADMHKYYEFTSMVLDDTVEMHKHLVLKSLAVLTGIDVAEVYDSNLFLRDRDLNTYLLEYIESSGRVARRAIPVIDDELPPGKDTGSAVVPDPTAILDALPGKLRRFIPELHALLTCSLGTLRKYYFAGSVHADTTNRTEEDTLMPSVIEKIVLLKNNELFKELMVNDLIHIARIAVEIELPRDHILIREGESGDELFILIEGDVKVYTKNRVLDRLGPGSCIGELSIVDKEPRSASVQTLTPCRLISIRRLDFLLTLRENPTISINIMRVMAERLRKNIAS